MRVKLARPVIPVRRVDVGSALLSGELPKLWILAGGPPAWDSEGPGGGDVRGASAVAATGPNRAIDQKPPFRVVTKVGFMDPAWFALALSSVTAVYKSLRGG